MELQAPLTILSIVSLSFLIYMNIVLSNKVNKLTKENKELNDLAHYTNEDLIKLEKEYYK